MAERKVITDNMLRTWHKDPPKERIEIMDRNPPGFSVRVGKRGIGFSVRYRVKGRQRQERLVIGEYPEIKIGEARLKAHQVREIARQGIDPKGTASTKEGATLQDAFAEMMHLLDIRPRTVYEYQRIFERDIARELGDLLVRDVTRAHVNRLIQGIYDRGAGVSANRTLALLRRIYAFAIPREYADADPTDGIKKLHRERPKQRVLRPEELREFWSVLHTRKRGHATAALIRTALRTGQRRSELASMRWSQIDPEGWWHIAMTKSHREHRIFLVPELIEELRRSRKTRNDLVFPSPRTGKMIHLDALSRWVARTCQREGLEIFTLHDLRRTVATGMAALGTPSDVVGRVLNHAASGVTMTVYNQHAYLPQIRQAMIDWNQRLAEIVER